MCTIVAGGERLGSAHSTWRSHGHTESFLTYDPTMAVVPDRGALRQRFNPDRKSSMDDLTDDAAVQLKHFIETNGHFSLVRYVNSCMWRC